jgi:hypothetical protein
MIANFIVSPTPSVALIREGRILQRKEMGSKRNCSALIAADMMPGAMSVDVNRAAGEAGSLSRSEAAVATAVTGNLRRRRTGVVRALLLMSGLALLRWIGTAIAALLGYRHTATVSLCATGLELQGERSLMGISLGATRELVPLASVQRLAIAARSPLWAVIAALGALVFSGVVATVLVIWGIAGRQPSWMLIGAAVIGCGVLLDALAYLWVRRGVARGLATLEIQIPRRRYRLSRVSWRAAEKLLGQLRDSAPRRA